MSRRLTIVLLALLYGLGVLLFKRWQRLRAARKGLALVWLEGFDHRALLDELETLYRAGRPGAPGEDEEPPPRQGELLEVGEPLLGEPVSWVLATDFDPERDPDFSALPGPIREAVTRLRAGELAGVETLCEPGQSAELDQAFASLGTHAFLAALYGGDLDRAETILRSLPSWTNGRIAPRLVAAYLGQVAFLRAQLAKDGSRHRWAREARQQLKAAAATSDFAEPAVRALWAKVNLRFFSHALNLELQEILVGRHLRKALTEHPHSPELFFELAYLLARRGQVADAIDNLARAAYFSGSRDFYRRPLLEDPAVSALKPGLVAQVRGKR
ncbi:MAG: hypothetical protein P1V51_24855 [Deltaproteobacteria bacterium]|nr:hypothetical protein [Deltaproteobacteria bacterium]